MKISICIPTYNQAQYLEKAIRSALEQTLVPHEIIVSNDCSTDSTKDLLRSLAAEIPILKIINQEVNLGIARNTDACLRAARFEFVIRLDSDDYLLPGYCEKLAGLLTQHPESGYAHANVLEIDQNERFLQHRRLARRPGYQTPEKALKASVNGYKVAANILMFRKAALEKVNYLTNRPDYVEDFHLSASLAASGFGNVFTDETLSCYRVWVDVGKVRQRRKLMEIVGLRRVFEDVLEPAFSQRRWKKAGLATERMFFGCRQADCLAWDVYSDNEKSELKSELNRLSSSKIALVVSWSYLSGYGKIVDAAFKSQTLSKTLLKKFYYKVSGRSNR